MYMSRYNVFTINLMFSKCLGTRYWMDGIGWVWMSLSQLGRYSQLGLLGIGLVAGLIGFGFSRLQTCQLVATVYLHTI